MVQFNINFQNGGCLWTAVSLLYLVHMTWNIYELEEGGWGSLLYGSIPMNNINLWPWLILLISGLELSTFSLHVHQYQSIFGMHTYHFNANQSTVRNFVCVCVCVCLCVCVCVCKCVLMQTCECTCVCAHSCAHMGVLNTFECKRMTMYPLATATVTNQLESLLEIAVHEGKFEMMKFLIKDCNTKANGE